MKFIAFVPSSQRAIYVFPPFVALQGTPSLLDHAPFLQAKVPLHSC